MAGLGWGALPGAIASAGHSRPSKPDLAAPHPIKFSDCKIGSLTDNTHARCGGQAARSENPSRQSGAEKYLHPIHVVGQAQALVLVEMRADLCLWKCINPAQPELATRDLERRTLAPIGSLPVRSRWCSGNTSHPARRRSTPSAGCPRPECTITVRSRPLRPSSTAH